MPSSHIEIARASYLAYLHNDRAAMEALIAEDFHFTSPLDNRIDRARYFERCWPNERIAGFEFIRLVAHADLVFATYVGRGTGGGQFRNTEVMTVRDGRITEVEVYFGWQVPHEAAPGGFPDSPGA